MSTAIVIESAPDPSFTPATRMSADDATRLRSLRLTAMIEERGLNASIVARRAGVSHSYISRIIRGERTPSLKVSVRLATALQVDLRKLAEVMAL